MTGIATRTVIISLNDFYEVSRFVRSERSTTKDRKDPGLLTFYGTCFTLAYFLFHDWIDHCSGWILGHQRKHLGRCWAWEPRCSGSGMLLDLERILGGFTSSGRRW
jgi:hypothetical protein